MDKADIIIIGAGAAGLMAARELSQRGKKVTVLEARNRTGGRIFTYDTKLFDYPAEAGAEFVHGDLPFTKKIIREACLKLLPVRGEQWDIRSGELTRSHDFVPGFDLLIDKLKEIKEDLSIAEFLDRNFPIGKFQQLHHSVKGFVEGFDAADPSKASTLALREEWMSENDAEQFRIKEGYGALIAYLEKQCLEAGVKILLNTEVTKIDYSESTITVSCTNDKKYLGAAVIITLSPPVLKLLEFIPSIKNQLDELTNIGFGKVIKFLFSFKNKWWSKVNGKDLSKLGFIFSNEIVPTWWSQYPEEHHILTGWLAGPAAEKYGQSGEEELLQSGIKSLANIFNLKEEYLKEELKEWKIIHWGKDPYALGAYAYATPESAKAKEIFSKPIEGKLFFAGEAFYSGKEMGTVEAALASGRHAAKTILNS